MEKLSFEEISRRLELPLEEKIRWANSVIIEYYYQMNKQVYVSFSGGKDSQVLLHLVRSLFPSVQAVFCDTGLEYPEIRKHVKTFDNVVWLKPKMKFPDVIKEYGFAVASKEVAQKISEIISTNSLKLLNKRLFGDAKGHGKLPFKWRSLLNAPFKVSGKCCNIFKKEPFRRHEKLTGQKPFSGVTIEESRLRFASYMSTGCNSFDKGKEMSRPISIWTEKDIWEYASINNIKFSEVYYDRTINEVELKALKRTGCMFCLFGIDQEEKDKPNRFQLMKKSHPRQYEYCINELGIGKVLDFINVKY